MEVSLPQKVIVSAPVKILRNLLLIILSERENNIHLKSERLPADLYFFNGFFNYTFSLVFTDITSDDPIGVVQGQQDDGGFSAVTPLSGNKFAILTF